MIPFLVFLIFVLCFFALLLHIGPLLVTFYIPVVVLVLVLFCVYYSLLHTRRVKYIRTFELPRGLYERLCQHHPHLERKDCQLVGMGLRQFFQSYLDSGQKHVSMPSQVVDDLWHEFILYTKHYEQFCRRAFGGFLHHIPAAILGNSKQGSEGLRRCWWHTCKAELIDPRKPTRLPLLFALDKKLDITNGFHYAVDCSLVPRLNEDHANGGTTYCAGDFSDSSIDGGLSGFGCAGSSDSSDGSDGDGGGCGGGCGGGGD